MTNILLDRWRFSGIKSGDTLLLHSNIRRTLTECRRNGFICTPIDILESFLDLLGPKGTLLLPLFNFDFTRGYKFDIRNTVSHMGVLTEVGRQYPGAVRTGHPIYSFAAIGYNSYQFQGVDNESGYSEDSPFQILRKLNGKIASLDLDDQDSMTFYHHVEELKQVDYRYFKSFKGDYVDENGSVTEKIYKLYVRDIERGILTNVNPAGEALWAAGLYKGDRPKVNSGLRAINSPEMFKFVEEIIDNGKALDMLYSIDNKNDRK
jgi:aminoglycoside 3-N-acetyltransferase